MKDGDKLSLYYTFNIPEKALDDSTKTLTYQLPKGIQLDKEKSFPLIDPSTKKTVGTGVVDTDGVVQLTFNEEFDTSKLFTGHFDFEAEASTVGTQESNTIRFPTGLELIVTLPRDLANVGLPTLTNKETESSGYVLPSTGGTGTLPFTAVGGTMMLTALAYSFIHHKRRREGRADD